MMVKGAIFFPEHVRAARQSLQLDELGQLFLAVCDYAEQGILPSSEHSGAWNVCFMIMKDDVDRNKAHYAEICERNRKNAMKRSLATASGGERPQATVCDRKRPQAVAANRTEQNKTEQKTNNAPAREAAAPPASSVAMSDYANLAFAKILAKHNGLPDDGPMIYALLEDIKKHGARTVEDALSSAAMSGPVTIERYRSFLPATR